MELILQSPPQGGHQGQPVTPSAERPTQKLTEGPWSDIEIQVLRGAIEHFQGHPIRSLRDEMALTEKERKINFKWSNVASHCQALNCRRNAKQCRERYINHMAPVRRDKIMPEEGLHIMQLVAKHGQKWAWIGRELNRAENTVKNYWNQERKKRENGKKRTSSHSRLSPQAETGRQQAMRAYSYPQTSRDHHTHSRRESLSSNPGLVSDHGSPVESSPRSSRHNSFAPVQQLPLPPLQGWKPAPASPIQPGCPMDRTQALSSSSAYSAGAPNVQGQGGTPTHEHFHQRGHPMLPHHSDTYGFIDRRGQQQSSVDSGNHRPDRGFEHPSCAYDQTHRRDVGYNTHAAQQIFPAHPQPRHSVSYADAYEQRAPRCSSYTAYQQSSTAPQMNLPYRTQRDALPPVSSIMNLASDAHQTPSNGSRNAQSSAGEMDLRHILN